MTDLDQCRCVHTKSEQIGRCDLRVFVGVDSTCSTQITDLEGGTRYAKFGVRFFAGLKNELKYLWPTINTIFYAFCKHETFHIPSIII